MDPILASAAQAVTRVPVGAAPEREAVLREGRVLAGEVLARTEGGNLLIALGRLRIPAQSQVQLDVGARFLARVVADAEGLALEILGHVSADEDGAFFRALRVVIGEERPISEILSTLAARLAAEGAEAWPRALSAALDAHVLAPGADGPALAALFARSGLRYEAALAFLARGNATPERLQEAARDLKHELLRALGESAPGPGRDAVLRALAGLEAEQLLNLARQKSGEPALWSLPVPDATGLATARLRADRRGAGAEGAGETAPDGVARLVLGVCFTNTGPLRADLALGEGVLSIKLSAVSEGVHARLERDLELIRGLLSDGRHAVHVAARLAPCEEVEVVPHPLETRVLDEHHLMDLSG